MSGLEDLLLYLGSSDDERQFAFHVLEIISLMFREQVFICFDFLLDHNQKDGFYHCGVERLVSTQRIFLKFCAGVTGVGKVVEP